VKNSNPTVEQSMFAAYQSQQKELDAVATAAATDTEAFATLHEELTALNTAAAAALAGVVGFSDEPSRLAAEAARVEFELSIAAQTPPEPAADLPDTDEPLSAESSVEELARGINTLNAEAQLLESQATTAANALATLTTTRDSFVAAMATFGATIPATATDIVNRNSDAAASFEDAVTSAVAGLTAAIESGQPGVAELQAYATAAAALQAEQTRLDALDTSVPDADTVTPPRTTPRTPPRSTTPTTPPATEAPAPETPTEPEVVTPTDPVVTP
jgi:hypothetical protein